MNRKIKKYSNIIFDFDGTLFDTNQLHEKAFKKTLKKFGYDENLIHYKEIAGISTLNVFKSLFNSEQAILLTKIKQKALYLRLRRVLLRFLRVFLRCLRFLRIVMLLRRAIFIF
jgi:phosphoglycolate phosphatase-like HAD superfamily hydrolase